MPPGPEVLPGARPSRIPAVPADLPAARRILLVEDDPLNRDLLRDVLEEAGYRVLPTGCPPDPADLRHFQPDLVILDLVLDGRPVGWDYLRALRALPATAHLPVVLCTADCQAVRAAHGSLLGLASDLVLKPFDLDDLLAVVSIAAKSASPVPLPFARAGLPSLGRPITEGRCSETD